MPVSHERSYDNNGGYRLRVLGCAAGALLLLIALVKFWPLPGEPALQPFPYNTSGQELITLEEIQPTRQNRKPPPPPAPIIPLFVSEDIVIENEIEVQDVFLSLEAYDDASHLAEGTDGEAMASQAPEVGPRPLRFVEPEYTRDARKKNIKAEIVVEILVDDKGKVKEAKIVERRLYAKDNKNKETVSNLGYGLEESALSAARRWTFRPARKNGSPVESYTTLTFSFGV